MNFVSQNKDTVLIVIVNGRHLNVNRLQPLVESLRINTSDIDYQIVVVLSNTYEENKKYLIDNNVFHINNDYNVGFPVAVNQGLKLAQTIGFEYVQILCDDLVFSATDKWLRDRVDFINSDLSAGMIIERGWDVGFHRFGDDYIEAVAAECPLIRIKAVNDVGYMDEFFTQKWNDIDYCIRFNMFGWRIKLMDVPKHFVHQNTWIEDDEHVHSDFPNGGDILESYLGKSGRNKFISTLSAAYPVYYEHKFKQMLGDFHGRWFEHIQNERENFWEEEDEKNTRRFK